MMAFFLLLWLLNAVTEQQLNGVADYFTPIAASTRESGAGGMLGGQTIGEGASESRTGSTAAVVLPPPSIGSGGGQTKLIPRSEYSGHRRSRARRAGSQGSEGIRTSRAGYEKADQRYPRSRAPRQQLAGRSDARRRRGFRSSIRTRSICSRQAARTAYPRSKALLIQKWRRCFVGCRTNRALAVTPIRRPPSDPVRIYQLGIIVRPRASDPARWLLEGNVDDRQIDKVVGISDREPLERTSRGARATAAGVHRAIARWRTRKPKISIACSNSSSAPGPRRPTRRRPEKPWRRQNRPGGAFDGAMRCLLRLPYTMAARLHSRGPRAWISGGSDSH